jgi:hypothetical protein
VLYATKQRGLYLSLISRRQYGVIFLPLDEVVMELADIPFGTTNWSTIEPTVHQGEAGVANWRTCQFGRIRVRMVEYSPGYLADHWCSKGHILLCLDGQLETELEDGRRFTLTAGMSYQVGDNAEPHRSSTAIGAKLFIVD